MDHFESTNGTVREAPLPPVGVKENSNKFISHFSDLDAARTNEISTELLKYDVKEPVGCALLVGDSYRYPNPTGVFQDLMAVEQSLKKNGTWHTKIVCNRYFRLTIKSLLQEIDNIRFMKNLEEHSIFFFYFTGDGNHEGILLRGNRPLAYSAIVNAVASIEQLKGKPIVFVFDNCRLTDWSSEIPCSLSRDDLPPHTFVWFSTVEGHLSLIHKEEGSFYSLALAYCITLLGQRKHIIKIATEVNNFTQRMIKEYAFKSKQRPMYLSTLDKLLYLSASGDIDEGRQPALECSSL